MIYFLIYLEEKDSISLKFVESFGPNSTKFPYFYSTEI